MARPFKLLVEGKNDGAAIRGLLSRHGYFWDAPERGSVEVISHDGAPELLRAFPGKLKDSSTQRLGVVLDADERPAERWQSVCDRAAKVGVTLPAQPDPKGVVVQGALPGSWFGVWVMPNNVEPGELEHFLLDLIPATDPCKAFASEVAQQARRKYEGQGCSEDMHAKSQIHTWLAWQNPPGLPFGTALKERLLGHDTEVALAFCDWFYRLFPQVAA